MQKTITRKRLNGLGDVVEAVTEATGIKAAVDAVAKGVAALRDEAAWRRAEAAPGRSRR